MMFALYLILLTMRVPTFQLVWQQNVQLSGLWFTILFIAVVLQITEEVVLHRGIGAKERKLSSRNHISLTGISSLSDIYKKRNRITKQAVVLMLTVAIMTTSIGIPLGQNMYDLWKKIQDRYVDYQAEADYRGDYRDYVLQDYLENEPSVENYVCRYYGNGSLCIPRACITEQVADVLQQSEFYSEMIQEPTWDQSIGIHGCDREKYEALRKINPQLGDYDEWLASGGVILDDVFNLSDNWDGETDQDNRYGIFDHFTTYQKGDTLNVEEKARSGKFIPCQYNIYGKITTPCDYVYPQMVGIIIFLPMETLLAKNDTYIEMSASIEIKTGQEEAFNLALKKWMTLNSRIIGQYNYIGVVTANEGTRIQFLLIAAVVISILMFGISGSHAMLRTDMEYQTKQFAIFRSLGMTRMQAWSIHMNMYGELVLDAMLFAMIGNLVLYYGILNSYLQAFL